MKRIKEIAIFSFTRTGNQLNKRIQETLSDHGYLCEGYTTARFKETTTLKVQESDMKTWIGKHWGKKTFLFIGASGIAIRYIAPWVRDKYTDSAVLVMDEKGEYIIPLLSGHMGGAVEAAREIEEAMHAKAVITTATDVQNKFAVDVFARDNDLRISDRNLVTRISAAVLEEESVGFYSQLPLADQLPPGIVWCDTMEELAACTYGIAVVRDDHFGNADEITAFWEVQEGKKNHILVLRSRRSGGIVAGIGCRRGTDKNQIKKALSKILKKHGRNLCNVVKIASIDLKKDEPGILELTEEYHIPFHTYPASELKNVSEEMCGSDFVRKVTGVDNVCERSARCCSPGGRLLQPKTIVDGITVALVEETTILTFKKKKVPSVLMFGGTTESLIILGFLQKFKMNVYLSVATEYGKESIPKNEKAEIICGRMDREEILAFLKANSIALVVDATHPFAAKVTENILWACQSSSTEYIRCLRKKTDLPEPVKEKIPQVVYVSSVKEAAEYLKNVKGNILITTGSKELGVFCEIPDYQTRCYARVLSVADSVNLSAEHGFTGRNLIAMQGPFSKEMNIATLHYADASYFVTKESGDAGGMKEKIEACSETGTTMVMIRRPKEEGSSVEEICSYLEEKYRNYSL